MERSAADIVRHCQLFAGLDVAAQAKVSALAQRVRFQRNQIIFRQDDPCPGLYVVASGSIRVYKLAASGKEHLLHQAGPGATFAEVAVIGGFDCPAHAQAIDDSVCALLPAEPFRALLRADHAVCLQLLQSMAGWVRQLVGLLEDVVLRDAVGRVARHILQSQGQRPGDEFSFRMLKKDLANHLNLTGETLSRVLRRLTEEGLIELLDAGQVRILDAHRLAQLVDGS